METGNWKLETRKSKLVYRRPRTEIRGLGFLGRVVSNFRVSIRNDVSDCACSATRGIRARLQPCRDALALPRWLCTPQARRQEASRLRSGKKVAFGRRFSARLKPCPDTKYARIYDALHSFQFLISYFLFPISRFRKVALALATTFVTLANTTALFGQSCAMCYNTAAAAKAAAIQALRSGILILLVPVALMFIGIFILAFRSKERFTESDPEQMDRDQGLIDWSESMPLNCRSVSQCVSESAHSPAVRLTN
jgi:hypothetical protein